MAIDLTNKKFLIIDDFSDMRSMLKHMILSYGAKDIDTAANGKDAVKLLTKHQYDIVLCDYNLGEGMDGQQVLEEAKFKNLLRFSTAFIMVTAENTMEMVMGAVEYQPDEYLSKPFNKDALKSRLEKILQKKSDFEDIERAVQKGKFSEAIDICDKQIATQPKNLTEFLKLKAHLCIKVGKYNDAADIYEKVLADRSTPWAKLGLGQVRFYNGDFLEARDIFRELVEENENHLEAYDWLAKTMVELEDYDEAEKAYLAAVEKSPKAIQRQMALGDLALKTEKYNVAEKAFKKAVILGRDSVYKKASNYTKQAKAMSKSGSGNDALKILKNMRKEFSDDEGATLQASISECMIYKDMNKEEEAQQAYEEATKLFETAGSKVAPDVTLEMAKACLVAGEKDKGLEIIKDVVKNHHEDQALLVEAQSTFDAVGMESEGKTLISNTRDEIVKLNNKGVKLAEDGNLEEAISYFEKAVKEMPENKTINLNTAKVLLMYMSQHGKNDRYLYQVRQHLERVHKADSTNSSYQQLWGVYEKMSKKKSA